MNAEQKDRDLMAQICYRLGPGNTYRVGMERARTLRRAQMTLHRWAEEMCNGTIQRDWDDETEDQTGRPVRWTCGDHKSGPRRLGFVPDRERGALARVEQVCKAAGLYYYHQTDPRGCALYVGAVPLTCQNYNTAGVACL